MKRNLHLIATACLLACGLGTASAQSTRIQLQVVGADDAQLWMGELSDVKWATFAQRSLTLTGQDLTSVLYHTDLPNVKRLVFYNPTAGIGDVTAEETDLRLVVNGDLVSLDGWTPGTPARATIYSVSGQAVYLDGAWDGSAINVARLPQGIYILKVNNNSYKFRKS